MIFEKIKFTNIRLFLISSMANPHVTGIAAMLMSENNFQSPSEVYDAVMNIATPNILSTTNEFSGEKLLAYNGQDRS